MKYIFLLLTTTLFLNQLCARENPFEPTDTYSQKQKEFYDKIEAEKKQKEQEVETARLQEELLLKREKELEELELQKQKELEELNKLQQKRIVLEKETPKIIMTQKEKVEDVKNYKVLPFVTVQTTDDALLIFVDPKFQLKNQDILKKQKKFLFDFSAHTSFYTIRKQIEHPYFKAYAVGTHRKEGFFRIVIDLNSDTKNYKETIDTKENIIKIEKI